MEEFERRKWGGIDQTYTCILIIFLNREKIWIGHRKGIWKQISTKKDSIIYTFNYMQFYI